MAANSPNVDEAAGGELSRANDAEVPIRPHYATYENEQELALERWATQRLDKGPPFRPRFMVYSGLGTPAMTSERLRVLQSVGAESFLLASDLPSQLGFDPDNELAHAQIGRAGVSCTTLEDFYEICADLDLARADSLGMLMNSVGHVGLGMVWSVLEDRGATDVKLVMQNDPLKEFTARGTEIFEPEQAVRIACDCVAYAIDEGMAGFPITVCSNHYDVAGSGPVVAMALAFANAIEYIDELVDRGYPAESVAARMMFFLNERSDLFVEASVFRVARVVWSEILSDRYGLGTSDQPTMTLMGYAHGLETAGEPLTNVVRCAISVLGSVLGGVDYLCASAYDEALRIPSADAAALAVRTMQIVGLEHGVTASLDGLAGSAKLAEIDQHIRGQVHAELDEVLTRGGAIACLRSGYISERIDDGRGVRERQIAAGERAWVGVNVLEAPDESHLFRGHSIGEIDFDEIERSSIERIANQKQRRDEASVTKSLSMLEAVAASSDNLLPSTISALRSGATSEEIITATRKGFDAVAGS